MSKRTQKTQTANRRRDNDPNNTKLLNYRELQKALKIEIEKSKNKSWETLCKKVDGDHWGLPYKIVTKKIIGRKLILGITVSESIQRIVEELFPTKSNIIWHTQQEKLRFSVTLSEINECSKKIPSGKAPCPDWIPDIIVKKVVEGRPNALCKAYNSCFGEAYFPVAWKIATLVLLLKGNKLLEQLSSYRPICLLNTVGKFFEKVIKRRLELHLSSTNGLIDNQYDFRRGKSTINAISKAMETVERRLQAPTSKKAMCVGSPRFR